MQNDEPVTVGVHPDDEYAAWLKRRKEEQARDEAVVKAMATQKAVDLDRLYNAIQSQNKNLVIGLCDDLSQSSFMSTAQPKPKGRGKAKPKPTPTPPNVASSD